MNKLAERIEQLSTEQLRHIAYKTCLVCNDETNVLFQAIVDSLMARLPEKEFLDFMADHDKQTTELHKKEYNRKANILKEQGLKVNYNNMKGVL